MDVVTLARNARESLARGLNALQSPGVPPAVTSAAESIAEAMSYMHRIEASGGAAVGATASTALMAARRALAALQTHNVSHAAVDAALEAVADSLGLIHELAKSSQPPVVSHHPAPPTVPSNVINYGVPLEQPPQVAVVAPPPPVSAQHQEAGGWQEPPPAGPTLVAAAPPPDYRPPGTQQPGRPGQAAWHFQAYAPPGAAPPASPVAPAPPPSTVAAPPPVTPSSWPQPGSSQPQPTAWHPPTPPAAQPAWPQSGPHAAQPASSVHSGWQPHTVPSADPHHLPHFDADLGAHSATNFYKGLSGNDVIDSGGLFIATYQIPEIGRNVHLKVSLPGGYEFEAAGVVRWTRESNHAGDSPPGFGVQFTHISPEGRQLVYRYVRNREPLFHDDL